MLNGEKQWWGTSCRAELPENTSLSEDERRVTKCGCPHDEETPFRADLPNPSTPTILQTRHPKLRIIIGTEALFNTALAVFHDFLIVVTLSFKDRPITAQTNLLDEIGIIHENSLGCAQQGLSCWRSSTQEYCKTNSTDFRHPFDPRRPLALIQAARRSHLRSRRRRSRGDRRGL